MDSPGRGPSPAQDPKRLKAVGGPLRATSARRSPQSLKPKKTVHLATKRRAIANQSIEERILRADFEDKHKLSEKNDLKFISFEKLNEVTLSGPHRKWVKELQEKLVSPKKWTSREILLFQKLTRYFPDNPVEGTV